MYLYNLYTTYTTYTWAETTKVLNCRECAFNPLFQATLDVIHEGYNI